MYAGLQPYAFVDDQLLLLVGLEENGKWSGFSGKVDSTDATLREAALREGYEELMGIYGTPDELNEKIDPPVCFRRGEIYPLLVDYDPKVVDLFNAFVEYSRKAIAKKKIGYYEKEAIAWVSQEDIRTFPEDYRQCFLKTIDKVIQSVL